MSAIMLHYFHGGEHKKSQGSISSEALAEYIEKRGVKHLLNADEWTKKLENNTLAPNDYCLTFDDNLKCQTDVAEPVLDYFGKTAFWFVYTSPYTGVIEKLELYRYFRNTYNHVDDFYKDFLSFAKQTVHGELIEKGLNSFPEDYLKSSAFYSLNDRIFRFLRDQVLGTEKYYFIMDSMINSVMKERNLDLNEIGKTLWFDKERISRLGKQGHYIGLHSHTHPTNMAGLPKNEQLAEYKTNIEFLENILGKKIIWMSHPCNSYNHETLEILQSLGIKYGFRANSTLKKYSSLELPRIDHADLIPA
jgi:peptidoglycan/xylan/chitin deacetylase (PgdA/CDA1 family)